MKSKAQFKSHPLHPILVPFPIAFFIGTFIFDVIAFFRNDGGIWKLGDYLIPAGIIGSVVAAIAGFTDYIYTVPPASTAKKRAAKHGLINSGVLIIFSISLYLRLQGDLVNYIIIALELAGVTLMSIAGWMGGTLIHRNQIGVDIRYAGAGKWKELYTDQTSGDIEVAEIDELKRDQMKLVHVKDKRIVLGRTEDGYVAFDDRCPHRGGSLAGGALICGTVQCPWHGSQFDVRTGALKAGPGKDGISTYAVVELNGKVFIRLS
jgi:uncharacterized membrane protein/nitrite reductase/ring-hydroxylating ferredoxin subunit